ncbi:MAG TPA: maleylpyruvate isomerase family mycothiol-dependent enzyme [Nocardioides sp.]|nr:maleylpyruvate isomerase family mycothiol-dependent enzyme [Nocardioides sp.]
MADPLDLSEATRRLVRTADALTDEQYAGASGLPGWTRAHVLAHLALNAEGLAGALGGVVEGRSVPMYASQEARDGDIDELAAQGPAEVRTRLLAGCTDLADAIAAVPEDAAGTTVERTPGGRTFAAADVPWMRLREVEIHHADLDAGYDRSAWSPEFAAYVLDGMLTRGGASAPFTARATDLGREWACGDGGPVVTGRAVDLAWWMTGRGAGDGLTSEGGDLPQMGAW